MNKTVKEHFNNTSMDWQKWEKINLTDCNMGR